MKNNIENGKIKKELTPEEKRIAISLESFPSLETKDKIFLVLVWRGLKTASPVSLEPGVSESIINDLQKRTEKAGLFFKKTNHVITEKTLGLRPGRICFVANNQKDLDLISVLWFRDHEHDPKVYKEIGRMSGFPQTAIDVFDSFADPNISNIKRENIIMNNILLQSEKKANISQDLYPFSRFFYMSKAHWKSEIETVRKWAEEIKLATPALYQSFIEDFKRSENAG